MFFWVAKQNSFVFYVKDFGVDILLCWLYKSWLKDLKKGGGGFLSERIVLHLIEMWRMLDLSF